MWWYNEVVEIENDCATLHLSLLLGQLPLFLGDKLGDMLGPSSRATQLFYNYA